MAEAAGDRDVNTRFTPRPPGTGRRDAPPPPPRPEIAKSTPPPATAPPPPPGAIVASRALWIMGFVAGIAAVIIAFYAGAEQREALEDVLRDRLDETATTLERLASVLFWATLIAILAVVLVESMLLHRMMGRHGGIRFGMLLMLVVHAGVTVLADAFLSGGDVGVFLRLLLAAQLLLSGVALVLSFLPGTGRWFRSRRELERRT